MTKNNASPSVRALGRTAVIVVAVINYTILMACEMSAQLVNMRSNFIPAHAVSIAVAVICVVIVEICLSMIRSRVSVNQEGAQESGARYDGRSRRIDPTFFWWALIALVLPAALFRLTGSIIPWELSAIPYGYFAGIFLTFRTLQTWQEFRRIL